MNEALLIWLYLSLSNIMTFIALMSAMWAIAYAGWWILSFIDTEIPTPMKVTGFSVHKMLMILLPLWTLVAVFPDESEMKYIIGGSIIINATQSAAELDGVKELPQNLINAANAFLEDVKEQQD